jgi:excinuclease UvrABC helicase subunit UvrB
MRRFNFDDLNEMFESMFGGDPFKDFKKDFKTGKDDEGEWSSESYTSPDGTWKSTVIYKSYFGSDKDGLKSKLRKPKQSENKVERLKAELERAVETEDFLLAIKLRDMIKSIEENKDKVEELQSKLKSAIETQDFESAIEIRNELRNYE